MFGARCRDSVRYTHETFSPADSTIVTVFAHACVLIHFYRATLRHGPVSVCFFWGGGENRRLPRLFCTQSALVDVEITERLQRNVCFVAGRDFLQWPVVVHHN